MLFRSLCNNRSLKKPLPRNANRCFFFRFLSSFSLFSRGYSLQINKKWSSFDIAEVRMCDYAMGDPSLRFGCATCGDNTATGTICSHLGVSGL